MDPIDRGPEEYGQDNNDYGDGHGEGARPQRPPRDALTPDLGQSPSAAPVRTVQLVAGDFLLTVNPVDGSEIEACPPGEQPARPLRHRAAERAELLRATRPPVPPGPPVPQLPLLERDEERERLVRLLARGRSVRLTGPGGSGRTALLDAVADDCAELAPDGVVRLSGYHRTPADLLHDLFAAVFSAPLHRPDRGELLELVHQIGAVVVLDDLEFGGAALDELLDATPECAFLLSATPETPAPSDESHLEEVVLGGLGRSASLELLERAVERPLTDEEANWAGDLWFESEGLPLRFVQAGALLRQRDQQRIDPNAFDAYEYFDGEPVDAPFGAEDAHELPLPSLGEGAAPAALLATRLSESARDTLRFAVALGGEVPHQAHLPALVGDTHADAALGELAHCGLLAAVGARYRLAAGVVHQLLAAGYDDSVGASTGNGESAVTRAHAAAQHYAWWASHPSVTPERAAAEADAVLAALTALVTAGGTGHAETAVKLARSAAPAFAAGLHWGAWERSLRTGQEAARISGEVAEEAYFHHELGVLALCTGNIDRARAELEASIAMRGALADKRGTVAGRRALALVADRSGAGAGFALDGRTPAGEEVPAARYEESASPPGGVPAAVLPLSGRTSENETVVTRRSAPGAGAPVRRMVLRGARRNMVAAGAGALLAAVLVTVVTLGATSGDNGSPSDKNGNGQSVHEGTDKDGLNADTPADGSTSRPGGGTNTPGDTGGNSANPADPATPSSGATGSGSQPGTTSGPSTPGTPGKPSTPGKPTKSGSPTKSSSPSPTPTRTTTSPSPSSPTPTPSETKTTTAPTSSNSASGAPSKSVTPSTGITPSKVSSAPATTTPPSTAPSSASASSGTGTVPA